MNIAFKIIVLLLAVLAQTTIAPKLMIAGATPNISLLVIIFIAFKTPLNEIFHYAFWSGLALDAFSINDFGASALCFSITAFLAHQIHEKLFVNDVLSRILLVVFCVAVNSILFFLIINRNYLYEYPRSLFFYGIPSILYSAILGTIITLLFYYRRQHD